MEQKLPEIRVPYPDSPREIENWRLELQDMVKSTVTQAGIDGTDNEIVVTNDGDDTVTLSISPAYLPTNVLGTTNQITVTNDTGTITLSLPSDVTIAGGFTSTDLTTNIASASDVGLTIKGASGQTANLMELTNNSGTNKFEVRAGGSIMGVDGMSTTSAQYGSAFWAWDYGDSTPEHVNQTGSYDHTGGAYENLFTKSAGDDFTQADADNGNWILLVGINTGAVAEIKQFIDADNVVVSGMDWDGDMASQTFFTVKHPTVVIGAGNKSEFSVGATGEFEIQSYAFTGSYMQRIVADIAADNCDVISIKHEANGYANSDTMQIRYNTGDLQAVDASQVVQISLNESEATGGHVDLLYLETTAATAAVDKGAIHVGTGFTHALTVSGGSAIDMDYGYELSTGGTVATDRVTGVAPGGTAFLSSSAGDVTIFDAVNDWIIIGNDDTFEVLEVILGTNSSKNLTLEFYYTSDGAGTWSPLPGVDDGTSGFTTSGLIDWTAPIGWAEDDETADGDAITEGYYIGIKRTRGGAIPTLPIEDYFKIYLEQGGDTGMEIKGNGVVKLPVLSGAPASPENGDIWMESDGLHIYYGGAEKVVAGA